MYPPVSSTARRDPKLRHGGAEPSQAFASFTLDQSAKPKVNQRRFFFFAGELARLSQQVIIDI